MQNYGFQLKHASTFPFPFFCFCSFNAQRAHTNIVSVCVSVCACVHVFVWMSEQHVPFDIDTLARYPFSHKVSQIFGNANKAETLSWGVFERGGRGGGKGNRFGFNWHYALQFTL